jgi:hypothetical protein|tara:strand:- start:3053 stop:3580 length:528 start_codon:yes stop_codon:yes gene_type:complete
MARYASNKHAKGISDRSGTAYRLRDMRKEWNGMLVGKNEWEAKSPQLMIVKTSADPQALRDPRPDRSEPAVEVLLPSDAFTSSASGSAVITVFEPGNGRATGDVVRFRDVESFDGFTGGILESSSGYSITVIAGDLSTNFESCFYTFTASSGTATTGSVSGGGSFATAGPVSITK